MPQSFDLVLRGGSVLTPAGLAEADVAVRGGRIAAIGDRSRGGGAAR